MISDFHSHILPGIDDGSRSVDESIQMLRLEATQGISRVIATPHFYAREDSPEAFLDKREAAFRRLKRTMCQYSDLPDLKIGAEVHYFHGISESEIIEQLTIDKKRCILIEMPHSKWTDYMYEELRDIYLSRNLIPILAHIDRYISPFRTHGILKRTADLPIYVQANASFFLHRSTARMALHMAREQQIHLLGSDCHNLTSRPPNLASAIDVIRSNGDSRFLRRIERLEQEIFDDMNESI